ncbi:hypothetical protein Btru_021080 [Bulinus truncatus]|nr:hypothetical protein Btru_021080 [Bulinus truncatus]
MSVFCCLPPQYAVNKPANNSNKVIGNGGMNIPVHKGSLGNQEKQMNLKRSPQDEEIHLRELLKRNNAEDALSESSGNSDPSDSGRGGSEDDSSHRGYGIDPEHHIYPNVYGREKSRTYSQANGLIPLKTHRPPQLSVSHGKQALRHSPSHVMPHRSLSTGTDSGVSDSGSSYAGQPVDSYIRPQYNTSTRPVSQVYPGKQREHFPSRVLTQDSPNRLAAPFKSSSVTHLKSFHGTPSDSIPLRPRVTSASIERLPEGGSMYRDNGPYHYSDRTYPMSEKWASLLVKEEDIRTSSPGSYSIDPDELRQEIDNLILRDSIV